MTFKSAAQRRIDRWKDNIVIERVIRDEPIGRPLTLAEQTVALGVLRQMALTQSEMARRTGVSLQTVKNRLKELQEADAARARRRQPDEQPRRERAATGQGGWYAGSHGGPP